MSNKLKAHLIVFGGFLCLIGFGFLLTTWVDFCVHLSKQIGYYPGLALALSPVLVPAYFGLVHAIEKEE